MYLQLEYSIRLTDAATTATTVNTANTANTVITADTAKTENKTNTANTANILRCILKKKTKNYRCLNTITENVK